MNWTWLTLFMMCAFAGWLLGASIRFSTRPPALLNDV